MTDPKHKTPEKEDYGGTGKTRNKPSGQPQEGAAPVHRDEENDAALSDVDADAPRPDRKAEKSAV
jgi:hypothetical protein